MNSLTSREQEVIMALAEGLSNKDVGRRLNLSEGTVKIQPTQHLRQARGEKPDRLDCAGIH